MPPRRNALQAVVLSVTVATAVIIIRPGPLQSAAPADGVAIGMVSTLFKDMPENLVSLMAKPFSTLMHSQTGYHGQVQMVPDAFQLADQMSKGRAHLGVFHGHEFAWVKQKFPELRPLVICITRQRKPKAYFVTRADHPAAELTDLKGKTLAIPVGTREHCRLYWEKCCLAAATPGTCLCNTTKPSNCDAALDQVIDGQADAALVDGAALVLYKDRKPGRFSNLRLIDQSEPFPAPVIAYYRGTLDVPTLRKFRDGLVEAGQTAQGRNLMGMLQLRGFEAVPTTYSEELDAILKSYPGPKSH